MAFAHGTRNSQIATIKIAAKELGMDDDTYRDMLFTVARVRSAADLDWAGRKQVIDHLKSRGFKVRHKKDSRPSTGNAQTDKIRALWLELHRSGAVRNPSEEALAVFVKRRTGIDAVQWLRPDQASKLIEEMKKWLARLATA